MARVIRKAPKASKKASEIQTAPNFVAKHMNSFNKATVEVDRKKAAKKAGHRSTKHKGQLCY